MDFEEARPFMEKNHRGVINDLSKRRGHAHQHRSLRRIPGNAAFVIVYGDSAKTRNLRRDPRCTVMAVDNDWRSHAVVEGQAQLLDYRNTPAEEFRVSLRDVYRACGGKDHPDWEEYDQGNGIPGRVGGSCEARAGVRDDTLNSLANSSEQSDTRGT